MATSLTLDSALEDVEARFLYNLPESELSQPDRLFFQIEQAWWFYEDFKADINPHLPHFPKLQQFAKKIFSHCPLLSSQAEKCEELFADFSVYKSMIPVYGVIMLSPDMKKMVLVCSYKGNSWSFPRGKVNQNEGTLACAVREALEETGFDSTAHCREEDSLVNVEGTKIIKLYIATNVPESTVFETQTRKEISKISFFPIDNLPSKSFGVYPFVGRLKRWINLKQKSKGGKPRSGDGAASSSGGAGIKRVSSKSDSFVFDGRNADTFADELASGKKGWGVNDMFKVNAKLTGRDYATYDGNPHDFGSSHPRYVNFNTTEDAAESDASSDKQSAPADNLKSLLQGKIKILSPEAFHAATTAVESNQPELTLRWPFAPFKLDMEDVMKHVRESLDNSREEIRKKLAELKVSRDDIKAKEGTHDQATQTESNSEHP